MVGTRKTSIQQIGMQARSIALQTSVSTYNKPLQQVLDKGQSNITYQDMRQAHRKHSRINNYGSLKHEHLSATRNSDHFATENMNTQMSADQNASF